ncbi:MAG TPA: hypothetical protein VFC65_00765 [Prolixibacteraceae bacterium]|nr:hypothetical protein [Prolixibacteraceae bacterium]
MQLKKFLAKALIFSSPIIICWLFIVMIDPVNIFNIFSIVDRDTKLIMISRSASSQPLGTLNWKAPEFRRKPCTNIIIGDSQSFGIKEALMSELTGSKFYNFSVPGANMETKFSIFWFAAKQIKLSKVIFQLSFPNWNLGGEDMFPTIQKYMDKPYLYLLNSSSLNDSYANLKYVLTKKYDQEKSIYAFPITAENEKLFNRFLQGMFKKYKFSDSKFNELNKIVSYCEENKISLEFLFLPLHENYYTYLSDNNLTEVNEKFISEISLLGKTYNYSTINDINIKEENFKDYFHQKDFITDSITRLIWTKKKSQQTPADQYIKSLNQN